MCNFQLMLLLLNDSPSTQLRGPCRTEAARTPGPEGSVSAGFGQVMETPSKMGITTTHMTSAEQMMCFKHLGFWHSKTDKYTSILLFLKCYQS